MKSLGLVIAAFLAIVVDSGGTTIQMYDGSQLEGTVQSIKQGRVTVAGKEGSTKSVALFDVDRIVFSKPTDGVGQPEPASKPWRIHLIGDDRLTAQLENWSDSRVQVRLPRDADGFQTLDIAASHIGQMWQAEPDQVEKARKLATTSDQLDVVYVKAKDQEGELKAVQGRCLGLDGDSLQFEFDGDKRTIALERVVGVVLATKGQAQQLKTFHQILELNRGDRITAGSIELDEDHVLRLTTPWNAEMRWPQDWVAKVTVRHGRRTYLSDLVPTVIEETAYFDRIMHFQVDESLANGPIRLKDGEYKRGIAVHSRCVLHYDLAGAYESFRGKVGFQQPTGTQGRAVVRVRGDDRVLFEELDVRGDQDPVALDLELTGVKTLILEVDFGENQDVGDRVVWADAQLIRNDPGS